MHKELAAVGIQFQLVEARVGVHDMLRAEGREESLGQISRRMSVDALIETHHNHTEPCAQAS
jgi:hypothetical protein